jgi:hypothetical protein
MPFGDELDRALRALDPDDLLPTREVRIACGDVADMTLWRWTRNPEISFPGPDLVLNGRKYWRRRTIEAWRARQVGKRGK